MLHILWDELDGLIWQVERAEMPQGKYLWWPATKFILYSIQFLHANSLKYIPFLEILYQ